MQKSIAEYMASTRGMGVAAQNHLRQLVERYPYYHAARLLLLRALYQNHDSSFSAELRKAALFLPSREVLYKLIEGDRLNPNAPGRGNVRLADAEGNGGDRTSSLIGQFLDSQTEQQSRTTHRVHQADATIDYLSFLEQTNADSPVLTTEPEPEPERASGMRLLDKFLDGNEKIEIHERPDEELQTPEFEEENDPNNEVLTETLAKIYIKQGKFDKALEIIRKLSLKYPKKNRYFVDQIRFLEKLIVNNKNK